MTKATDRPDSDMEGTENSVLKYEIENGFKSMKNSKAPGEDNVREILIDCGDMQIRSKENFLRSKENF